MMNDAVEQLATGGDKIKVRLMDAYSAFSPVSEDDFPDDLKPDYCWMMDKLTKKEPVMDEGRVRATLLGMHTKNRCENC